MQNGCADPEPGGADAMFKGVQAVVEIAQEVNRARKFYRKKFFGRLQANFLYEADTIKNTISKGLGATNAMIFI